MSFSKLQVTLANFQSQLKMEKVSSLAKDRRIKYFEDLVIRIGQDPSSINAIEDIIRKKNTNIEALRKQLKLLVTEDPLTKGIEERESQKADMMKLIMEKNVQLKQMETYMEKIIKEKEQVARMSIIPLEVVPLIEVPTSTSSTTNTGNTTNQLASVANNMSLQT